MRSLRAWFVRMCHSFRKQRVERDLSEEIEANLQLHIDDNLRAGMAPEEARRQALLKFGGVEQTKEAYRDRAGIPGLETLFRDLRYGLRMLRKNRGFTVAAVLSLALGTGASTAVFSILDTVFLRPLPYPDAGRLVWVAIRFPSFNEAILPSPDYVAWRRSNHVFSQLAATQAVGDETLLLGGSEPAEVRGQRVSFNFLATLGITPELGRSFRPREELPNAQKTVMLTDRFWRGHFHADRKILGHAITLAGQTYTVIGVLPPSFVFPLGRKADVLTTLPVSPTASHHDRFGAAWTVIGRLKPGVTLAEARANAQTLFAASKADAPRMFRGSEPIVKSLQWRWVQYSRLLLFVMAAAAGCFLLIACANVANLLLARFSTRSHELAVRAAIGAGRARLVRQLLTEVALLTTLGCALGMAIVAIALRGFVHFAGEAIPRLHAVHADGRVFAIALLVSVLTAALLGVLPALRAGRVDVHAVLQQAGRAGLAGGRSLLRRCLVAMEVALSVVLLCGAALLLEALWHLENDHLGFPPEHVLTISLPLGGTKFGKGDRRALADEFLAYLRRIPGTTAAAISQCTPLTPGFAMRTFTRSDRPLPEPWHHGDNIAVCGAGPGYLKAAGIPLIRGRFFSSADFQHRGTLAVINQAAARTYFSDEDPLGKQIVGGHGSPWKKVIGIVGDTKNYALNRPPVPQMFVNNLHLRDSGLPLFLVRSAANENALTNAIRAYLHSLDPRLLAKFQTLDQVIAQRTTGPRFDSVLIAAFASIAFLMAVIGVYGVLSFSVVQRTQEIGIRIALGAQPRRVMALISREGALLASIGIAAGLGGALALTRYLGSLLYEVKPDDPATYAAVVIGLCVTAAIATYFPARRASKIDPVEALRRE